jgi:D-amino peptidase
MRTFLRVALVLLGIAVLSAANPARFHAQAHGAGRGPKIYISIDMEGITGVVQPSQLGPTGFEYGLAREWMTGELLAAIEGARAAGAGDIVVSDSHGNAQNVLIDRLPEDVRIVRGFPRPLSMMQGIDESFQAAIFVGYHASEWGVDAVRGHTISSAKLLGVRLNGKDASEGIINAGLAAHFKVPVIFVSGDRQAVESLRSVAPWAEGVVVKEGLGYHSALSVTPARGRQLVRDGVTRALGRLNEARLAPIAAPVAFEIGFKLTIDAERAAFVPGLSRADAHWVRGTVAELPAVTRLIQVLTSLEAP